MPYLSIFGLEFEKHPRIFQNAKFRERVKMSKRWTKNVLFEYFGLEIWKKQISYLRSAPSNLYLQIEILAHKVNFCIGSAISKGRSSAFSEGPGPGQLYKV